MKTNHFAWSRSALALCFAFSLSNLQAQTAVDEFEYATNEDLAAAWTPSPNATLSVSEETALYASGESSMQVVFDFPTGEWATESIAGLPLAEPVALGAGQYVSLRLKGDPAFAAADFKNFYVYVYDDAGNFGRWGVEVPTTDAWQILNFTAAGIEKPWDSTELPNLSQITRFAFFQYGSQAALPAYSATIHIDELSIRDEPLTDPAPPAETVVETFEYSSDEELLAAWAPSPNASLTLSDADAALSTGEKALSATFNFPSMEWATEWITGAELATPVSIAPEQYVTFRVKGDAAFAGSDFNTLYLYAYDAAGNFGRWGAPIPQNDAWAIFNFEASAIEKPWDSTELPNLGAIVRFSFYQYGSQGAIAAYSATIGLDDLMIRNSPLVEVPTTQEQVLESFEYPTEEELLAAWIPTVNAVVTRSEDVSPRSTGTSSMKVEFNFPSGEWVTGVVRGPVFPVDVSIAPEQYITLRLKGDPAFSAADFRDFYLYVYDVDGNFGRWGTPIPITEDWQVINFRAGSLQQPWDSPGLPDLSRILSFAIFQYGSQAILEPYTATLHIDDLMVRNSPLLEFPLPSDPRSLIDDFESYADDAALRAAYSYQNSPAATGTTASLESPAPQGDKALRLDIDFAAGQYPWGSVRSAIMEPFSLPEDAVVTLRLKGDPALAALADGGTTFWLSFYDQGGRGINYIVADPVFTDEWTTLEATLADFGNTATVDIGNLVQWRILVQAYEGTADHAAMSGSFLIDDIRIGSPEGAPSLALDGHEGSLTLTMNDLTEGNTYELHRSTDLKIWGKVTDITATSATATHPVELTGDAAFFKLVQPAP